MGRLQDHRVGAGIGPAAYGVGDLGRASPATATSPSGEGRSQLSISALTPLLGICPGGRHQVDRDREVAGTTSRLESLACEVAGRSDVVRRRAAGDDQSVADLAAKPQSTSGPRAPARIGAGDSSGQPSATWSDLDVAARRGQVSPQATHEGRRCTRAATSSGTRPVRRPGPSTPGRRGRCRSYARSGNIRCSAASSIAITATLRSGTGIRPTPTRSVRSRPARPRRSRCRPRGSSPPTATTPRGRH